MVEGEHEWVERDERMHELESRIARTEAGDAWLQRIRQIGKPEPLHSGSQQGESHE